VLIAHRQSTAVAAEQVAAIENGRVVEGDPPDDLIARGGRFAGLYGRWLAGVA
jgi:ATP-binding cassette subfamily B protein